VIDPPHRDFPFRASEWDTYTRPPRYGHTGGVLGGWGTHGFTIFEGMSSESAEIVSAGAPLLTIYGRPSRC
jgi:hypothetical protein